MISRQEVSYWKVAVGSNLRGYRVTPQILVSPSTIREALTMAVRFARTHAVDDSAGMPNPRA